MNYGSSGAGLESSGGDLNGVGVEFGAGGMAEGGGDDDGVALEARDHVQVNVEDILAGRFAVGEEEVDTFAAQAGTAHGGRHALGDAKQVHAGGFVQLGQVGGVGLGDDQQVTRHHGIQVHKGQADVVLEDDTCRRLPCGNRAEDAIDHVH